MWEVEADGARFERVATPARRTVDIVFDGKPDLQALRTAIGHQDIAGAHVRVRWTVADEDRHEVDRALIERELGRAAEVKLEGRVVPVVRTRAAGISLAASLADKVRQWAQVTGAKPEPLLACLAQLEAETGEAIAEGVLRGQLLHDHERAARPVVEKACFSD
jgi:exonuclease SbcD